MIKDNKKISLINICKLSNKNIFSYLLFATYNFRYEKKLLNYSTYHALLVKKN